jgi:Protein of unknown function (DUF2771)
MSVPPRASRLIGFALVGGALLTGCGQSGPPSVEFSSAAGTVSTGPAQYCDLAVTQCANHPDAVIKLAVPPGAPLRINVPTDVAAAPWHVVFSPKERTDYQLVLPDPADQLLTAQVQQFGGNPSTGPDGEMSFPIRGSWVLATS